MIFQYDSTIYCTSYLSRSISIVHNEITINIQYRKIKDEILYDPQGIVYDQHLSYATKARAINDMRYLQPDFYFDNLTV